jgi:hypothetical protein
MAHWRLTPEELKKVPEQDLELLELSFLLLERRQTETLDSTIGALLGASWDAENLLGGDGKVQKEPILWSKRHRRPKVILPLSVALTQNPKFFEQLKAAAHKEVSTARTDASVLNMPMDMLKNKNYEFVDLSFVPIKEFMKVANTLPV